jgi:glycosyltransferase involved in cell wall biosynthesis
MTFSMVSYAFKLRNETRERFDLLYAHNQYVAMAGWLIGRVWHIPNVTRLYGTFLADLMEKPAVWLRYPVAVAGFLVPHSLLICTNDGTRGDEVARRLRIDLSKFRFWQNGVDFPKHSPRATREEFVDEYRGKGLRMESKWIISCSRLSYWKRIDRILHGFSFARKEGCDGQLLIAGDGPERDALARIASRLGIQDDVVWLGALAHHKIWDLMQVADMFIITNDVTNRCNPLYEAICAGLPIVSVLDPSTTDLLTHHVNAMVAPKNDANQVGEYMYKICMNDELHKRLAENQREQADKFWSWEERMAFEIVELEKLLNDDQ